jgi:hypothetical protein
MQVRRGDVGTSLLNPHIQHGSGAITDFFSKIAGKSPGLNPIQQLTKAHGSAVLTNINVYRTPIRQAIIGTANLLSLGKLNEAKKNLNYDNLFHLSMIIALSDGYVFKLEKNEAITINSSPSVPTDSESRTVPGVLTRKTRIDTAIDNCSHLMGQDFYTYSALSNNCQHFVASFLKSNGWLTPELNSFIMQDVGTIAKNLPTYMSSLMNNLTDIASAFKLGTGADKIQSGGVDFSQYPAPTDPNPNNWTGIAKYYWNQGLPYYFIMHGANPPAGIYPYKVGVTPQF